MKSKTIAILVNIFVLINTVPSFTSDFLPLDVWEDMANWQQTRVAINETDIEAYGQSSSMNWEKAGIIHTSFPFDVMDELTDLDGKVRHDINGRSTSIDNSHGHQTNPYWLPAEYGADQVDPSSVK